ncbi:MAG: ATP-binding protein [Planctomycetota bacterium]|nr:MAG: ATP-binding protein [Planctomycetota bacterium]
MATADQLKYLIQSHFDNDETRFTTLALQVAAHEARAGHQQLAVEIRKLIDKSKEQKAKIIPFKADLSGLVLIDHDLPDRLADLIVSSTMAGRIERILKEFRQQETLKSHGMSHRRKLLLCGPPGCGKTLSASVIAGELSLPLCTILMDKLVTKFMGETSAKLRQVFDAIAERRAVYLFDEFDAIGAERNMDNDVGEIRRVLNAFLQLIERDQSDSLIIAATNNHAMLDQALFRRFDDIITYHLPDEKERSRLLTQRLGRYKGKAPVGKLAKSAEGLSHGEISMATNDAIKDAILANRKSVDPKVLSLMLEERHEAKRRSKGQ